MRSETAAVKDFVAKGDVDIAAKGLFVQKLLPQMPMNFQVQYVWNIPE